MLVLSRKVGESLVLGEGIEVKVVEIKGDRVKLAISAPREIGVWRKEVYEAIVVTNREAQGVNLESLAEMQKILK